MADETIDAADDGRRSAQTPPTVGGDYEPLRLEIVRRGSSSDKTITLLLLCIVWILLVIAARLCGRQA